jgi:5'-phosphate synthase pdxT subunit
VFIRAPWIESAGNGVQRLAVKDGKIIAARERNLLATSFHPELTDNAQFHKYFLSIL